ncbi:hypothetical protein HSACCH_01012 [Halanaerobium saccharolyticum subsp. saccharolyticum DSM 6643]|uniref:DUF401 family protein n=1 Tax=Halanaerobium saccharolyticum subsp. saccharolyticum DSM 6643 TaxID=1293054 RepID=M5DZ74_9FIRM|nr:DUF401 family protein [Halanaerobium saccharolyticum]CCU78947.1 hypothetical protein HSACCH_01012 [Halanaerobium saccharolyticum subsp. saccharolyticum DSM 6643]
MGIIGLIIAFSTAIFLIFKDYNMGLSLFLGAVILNFFSGFGFINLFEHIIITLQDPTTIKLMLVVTLISGLGFLMDLTGDMRKMIDACINIFKDGRLLSMILPALIGTLSAPGGAILSAPMINETGDKIGLDNNRKTAINLFYRHIGYFIYPLFSSIIVASSMLNKSAASIVKYNIVIMLSGLIIAFFVLFRNLDTEEKHETKTGFAENIYNFSRAFFPIFITLFLALVIKIYFPLAVLIGVVTAVLNNWPEEKKIEVFKNRFYEFFTKGIKYKLTFIIFGVMVFKTILEKSGVINIIAEGLTGLGLPLFLIIIVLGFISGYITGVHVAATGILLAIFIPLFPVGVEGPYVSLLLTSIIIGYLVSPLHLCLALTTEYFSSEIAKVYQLLFLPLIGMILAGVIQIIIFT